MSDYVLQWVSNIKNRPSYRWALYTSLLLLVGIYSFINGWRTGANSDFNVFWMAGRNFSAGLDLYSRIGGAERYIYPPFAAMLFQLFSLFPLKLAASIYTFVNFALFIISIDLSRKIMGYFTTNKKQLNYAILFGVICSFRFVWYHILFVQMNELILVLCLAGVLASLKGKEWHAVLFIVGGMFIKILPIFFLPWLLMRGNSKTIFKIITCSLVCILLPFIWRFGIGWNDLHNYYISFLEPFKEGRVEPEFHNQSLAAAIYKLCLPTTLDQGYDYNLFHLTISQAAMVYKGSFILLFGLLMGFLAWEKYIYKQTTLQGIALILICMHLLSGITWEYHLISLMFVYAVFALYYKKSQTFRSRLFFFPLAFFVILFSIVGKDTLGTFLYHYLEGYSVITCTMVGLFFYMLVMKNNQIRKVEEGEIGKTV